MGESNKSVYVMEFDDYNILFDLTSLESKVCTKEEMYTFTREDIDKSFIESEEYISRFTPIESDNIVNPTIITSSKCNYSCEYCFEKQQKDIRDVMSTKDIVKIAEFYEFIGNKSAINYKIGDIAVMGGEPLLMENKNTLNSIAELWDENTIRITTNGSHLIEYMDYIKKNQIEIRVSLGGTEEVHLKRRHCSIEGVYDKTIQGIKELIANGISTTIMIVFNPDDINNYVQLFDMFIDLGWTKNSVLKVAFIPEVGVGCDDMTEEKIIENLKAFRELKKKDQRTHFVDARKLLPGSVCLISGMHYAKDKKYDPYRCSCIGKPDYTFMPDGRVLFCSALQEDEGCIGRFKPTIEVNFDKINQLKARRVDSLVKCKKCDMKALCMGGCAATVLSKNMKITSSYCGFWKNPSFLDYLEDIV